MPVTPSKRQTRSGTRTASVRAALACILVTGAFSARAQSPAPGPVADLELGRNKAVTLCAACHGANGISVGAAIPNLAGQKSAYLAAQLAAFKDGRRRNDVMAAIAGPLTSAEIAGVAAYYAGLPGAAASSAASAFLPELAATRMSFLPNFPAGFKAYHTIDFPDRNQVRRYWANDVAFAAARAGTALPDGSAMYVEVFSVKLDEQRRPVKGADGHFAPDRLLFYTAMERRAGWGSGYPEALRNEDWNYASFGPDKSTRTGANQAECLACHKPLPQDSYLFTLKPLREAAAR